LRGFQTLLHSFIRSWKLEVGALRGFQTLLRSVQMSMPGIIERRRRLNAERSEAIERHEVPLESYNTACSEVPIPQSNQSPVKYAALLMY